MRAFLPALFAVVAGCSSASTQSSADHDTDGGASGSTATGASSSSSTEDVAVGDAPTQGPASAKVTVIEFGDFECPYCGEEEPVVTQILANYSGRIRFVFKEFPLSSIHPYAELAAEAALAANAQGEFWPYHNMLYANQSALGESDLEGYAKQLGLDVAKFDAALNDHTYASAVAADVAQGTRVGVDATPTFFVNGNIVVGAAPYSQLAAVIDAQLAAAK